MMLAEHALGELPIIYEKATPKISCFSKLLDLLSSFQFSLVAQLCPTLCNPMDCSNQNPLPVHHQLPELVQTNVC